MLGDIIKRERLLRGYNQIQLGKLLGVSKQTISNWENNNILPSIEMLVKISKLFKVSTDYLLGLDDRRYIEITGLNDIQLLHITNIINDIKGTS